MLAERPKRGPITPKTFRQEEVDLPELKDGEVLVKVDYVSVVRAGPIHFTSASAQRVWAWLARRGRILERGRVK